MGPLQNRIQRQLDEILKEPGVITCYCLSLTFLKDQMLVSARIRVTQAKPESDTKSGLFDREVTREFSHCTSIFG